MPILQVFFRITSWQTNHHGFLNPRFLWDFYFGDCIKSIDFIRIECYNHFARNVYNIFSIPVVYPTQGFFTPCWIV
nr:MAG TPA: hypothetical protein [Caudoviricetes sp.]